MRVSICTNIIHTPYWLYKEFYSRLLNDAAIVYLSRYHNKFCIIWCNLDKAFFVTLFIPIYLTLFSRWDWIPMCIYIYNNLWIGFISLFMEISPIFSIKNAYTMWCWTRRKWPYYSRNSLCSMTPPSRLIQRPFKRETLTNMILFHTHISKFIPP